MAALGYVRLTMAYGYGLVDSGHDTWVAALTQQQRGRDGEEKSACPWPEEWRVLRVHRTPPEPQCYAGPTKPM
jgi:hypothetical protein